LLLLITLWITPHVMAQSGRPFYYSVASGDPTTGVTFGSPVLNNSGSIAFDATKYQVGTAILTGPDFFNDAFVNSAANTGPFKDGRYPQINEHGSIAFNGTVRATNETGIFVGLDAAHNLVAGNGAISYSANGINDSGQVIIAADFGLYTYNPQRNHDAIFLGQAGVSGSALVAENTRLSAPGAFRTLSRRSAVINNAGQIAFTAQAWESTANGYGEGIYSGATSESAIITTAGRFFTFQSWIDMNDSGTLAFVASEDNAYVPGVYVGRGEDATLLASEGATFVGIKWVDINNHGSVVFNSQLGAAHGGFNGIFNGPTFQDRVIGPGDELFGSTVRDAFFRDIRVIVPSDAAAAVTPELHEGALADFEYGFGTVTTVGQLEAALAELLAPAGG
jgi:hypothetical protein